MPEIQIDVAVANRFISSLSKSLQALCHGCMDFDSGIEIVGYINVNIDSGSKVDYVLNEKVLKSTTNSMTFVSNSFFAKKEQPKQSRDGSCSPIPELVQPPQMMSPYQSRMRGSHPRTGAPFSQAYGMRGSHKRSWASMERDWRISPKRQREGRPQYPMSHDPSSSSSAQSAHFSAATSSSQNPADPNFGWTQPSAQSSDTLGSDTQSNVNIKKEVFDSDTDGASAQTEQEQSQSADQTKQDNSDPNSSATGINIKRDPDASTSAADEETAVSEGATTDTDFKGTFLQPSTETPHQEATAAEESDNTAAATEEEQDISQTETSNQNSAAENTSDNHEETASSEMIGDNVTPASDMPVEFDEAGEEGAYPQSVYSDLGEGSSDAGQFEVIEIDDEDEDVQAMFGESHPAIATIDTSSTHKCSSASLLARQATSHCRTSISDDNSPMKTTPEKATRALKMRLYRQRLKENGKYENYKEKQKVYVAKCRQNRSDYQKQRDKELTHLRVQKYRERKKAAVQPLNDPEVLTRTAQE